MLPTVNFFIRHPAHTRHALHTVCTLHMLFTHLTLRKLYAPQSTLHIAHSNAPPSTLHVRHSQLHTPHSPLHTNFSCSVQFHARHPVGCKCTSTHHTLELTPLRTPHSRCYIAHFTLPTRHFTLHTANCTVHMSQCIPTRSTLHAPPSTPHSPHLSLQRAAHFPKSSAFHLSQQTPHSILYEPRFKLNSRHSTPYRPHTPTFALQTTCASHGFPVYTLLHFTLCTLHTLLST